MGQPLMGQPLTNPPPVEKPLWKKGFDLDVRGYHAVLMNKVARVQRTTSDQTFF